MTEILKVTESLKSLIYGPTCSVQSAEDRAIVIEDNLTEIIATLDEAADQEEVIDELKRECKLANARSALLRTRLKDLIKAVEALSISDAAARVGSLIVADGGDILPLAQREQLKDALKAANKNKNSDLDEEIDEDELGDE